MKKDEEVDQQIDVFNIIIQKRPNTVVHLKIEGAMEGRRSHMEVRSRSVENLPYCLSGLLLTRKLLKQYRSTWYCRGKPGMVGRRSTRKRTEARSIVLSFFRKSKSKMPHHIRRGKGEAGSSASQGGSAKPLCARIYCLERDLSALLLKALAVGRR